VSYRTPGRQAPVSIRPAKQRSKFFLVTMRLLRDNEGNDSKQTNMNCHPTTSGNSHPLDEVFLGVSKPNQNQKSLELQLVSA
jgi:hypothetical protein